MTEVVTKGEAMSTQQKSRLSSEPSANATDSLRAQPRSGEIGHESIIPQNPDPVHPKTAAAENNLARDEELPAEFNVKNYVEGQIKDQKGRDKAPMKERIANTTAQLKHFLVDDAVAYERYVKNKDARKYLREGVDRVRLLTFRYVLI